MLCDVLVARLARFLIQLPHCEKTDSSEENLMAWCRKSAFETPSQCATFTATSVIGVQLDRAAGRRPQMTTKVCTNSKCPAYAHFVYTVAMRCVLCRCDLMAAAHRNLDAPATGHENTDPGVAAGLSRKSARTHAAR